MLELLREELELVDDTDEVEIDDEDCELLDWLLLLEEDLDDDD